MGPPGGGERTEGFCGLSAATLERTAAVVRTVITVAAAKKSVTKKTAPVAAPPPPRCLHAADHIHFVERLCQHIKCSEIQGFGAKVFVRKA